MFDLDYLSELEQKATPGEWHAEEDSNEVGGKEGFAIWGEKEIIAGTWYWDNGLYGGGEATLFDQPTAEFIAALRNAAPALFAEIRELRVMRENIRHITDSGYADVGDFQNDLRLALTEAQKQ